MDFPKQVQTESVVINGATYDLELRENSRGTWVASGTLANGAGLVVTGFKTADEAVAMWIARADEED